MESKRLTRTHAKLMHSSSSSSEDEPNISKFGQILATVLATIGSFGLGTVLSWPAPSLHLMTEDKCGEDCTLILTVEQGSWVAALMNFGAFTAGPLVGILMPKIGKKWTMIVLCGPILAGWMCLVFADRVEMLYIGRFLTGFSGAFSMLAPGFTAEICQVEIRGALASFMQVMTMLGLLSTYTLGTWLSWRHLSAVSMLPPILVIFALYFVPRSPVFLLAKGFRGEAKKSLRFFRGPHADIDSELAQMEEDLAKSRNIKEPGMKVIFTNRTYLFPLLISLLLMLLQQFSGIKVISSYIVTIFQNAGSKFDANISSIIVGIIQVTGTSISVLIVDKFGRRRLLILSELFICVAFIMLATFFFLQEKYQTQCLHPEDFSSCRDVTAEAVDSLAWLPLASIVTFAVAYSMGMGPLPWVLNAELFSREAKAPSSSLCASFNWLCSFIVVKFAPTLEKWIGPSGSYSCFAVLAAAGTLAILAVVPETRGKTEEEVKMHFVKDEREAGGCDKTQNCQAGKPLINQNGVRRRSKENIQTCQEIA